MNLKKYILISLVVLAALIVFPQAALADGWWRVNTTDTITADMPVWTELAENDGYASPHGGFTTSSNICKTCHAVHGAGADSYRLLKSGSTDFEAGPDRTAGELRGEAGSFSSVEGAGNSRSTECMYCHDASSGLTELRPYALTVLGATVRGEHTLGATSIPDSDTNGGAAPSGNLPDRNPVASGGIGPELDCYQCHSVHGANTIGHDADHDGALDPVALDNKKYDGNDDLESWNTKILRVDPSGDSTPLALGTGGMTADELANEPTAVRTGFCADCHNRNPNWVTTTDTVGPNKTSHVQGRGADGLLEVYGQADVAVAGHLSEAQGCRGCHAASDSYAADSRFPHQSVGWKLMWDSYTDTGTADLAGDPNRFLPVMDRVCLMCHPVDDEFESGKGYSDVATEQLLCFRCHRLDSFAGAPNIQDQFAKASAHPTGTYSGRHTDNTSETPAQIGSANRHAECLDCHNMEAVLQGQGRPLRGIWGASAEATSAGLAPTMTKIDGVTMEYELCFKCHSSYTTRPASNNYEYPVGTPVNPQPDKALEFNTNNNAFHPVEGAGRNASNNLNQQLAGAGLTTDSIIKCTDCHNSEETGDVQGPASGSSSESKGPHGSTVSPVLRANYLTALTPWPASYDPNNFELCFLCHDEDALVMNADTNFFDNDTNNINLHKVHLKTIAEDPFYGPYSWVSICRNCHYNVHSNQAPLNTSWWYWDGSVWRTSEANGGMAPAGVKSHLVSFSPDISALAPRPKPRWLYNSTTRRRTCQLVCHDGVSMSHGYTPAAGDDDVPTF